MLIEQPHALGRIHRGAAAERDDDIGLEFAHHSHAAHDRVYIGIGLDVGIDFTVAVVLALAQIVKDFINIAELDHHRVGHDKRTLDILHFLEILDGILFEVDLRRNLEPLHIDPPLGKALFVDEVNGGDVGGRGVVAVGAAAEGERRCVGVVDIADTALRRGRVDDHAAYLHLFAVGFDDIVVGGVDDRRVTEAAHVQHFRCALEAFLRAVDHKVGEHRAQLFTGQRIFGPDSRKLCDQDLRLLRDLDAGMLCNPVGALAHDVGVNRLLLGVDHIVGNLLRLLRIEEVAVVFLHNAFEILVDFLIDDDRLLGSADHAVVKGFGEHQVGAGALELCAFLNIAGHVAGADAQSGLTGAVCALDHACAAGGEDEGHARMIHQSSGCLNGGRFNPLDAVFRRAGLDCRIIEHFCSGDRALLCIGMKAEDHRVAGFHADQRFEHRGGGGVRNGGCRSDNANRLRDLHIAFQLILFDDANGFFILDGVPDIFGGEHVLDDLVFIHAATGFFNRHFREPGVVFLAGDSHRLHDFIYLLLRHVHKLLESFERLLHMVVYHCFNVNLGGFLFLLFVCHCNRSLSNIDRVFMLSRLFVNYLTTTV